MRPGESEACYSGMHANCTDCVCYCHPATIQEEITAANNPALAEHYMNDGEHTPYEMDSYTVEDVDGVLVETEHVRLIMCTCLPADVYPLPWGHHEVTNAGKPVIP